MPETALRPTSLLNRQPVRVKAFLVFLCLYLFLVGIGAMGTAVKLMGGADAEQLIKTSGPLVSLFVGILATTLVQSSSTSTSAIVTLVAAGQLGPMSGMYMVMGANVGTTVTNTIVSLGHITRTHEYRRAFAAATVHDFFNVLVLLVLFPLEVYTNSLWGKGILAYVAEAAASSFETVGGGKLGSPIKIITGPMLEFLKWVCLGNGVALLVVGLLLMFSMLIGLVRVLKALTLHRVENLFDKVIFRTPLRALFFGFALTVLVQSSSITTSVAVPLVGAGILTIRQVFPYTMGANIGTTCTALLAALGAMAIADSDSQATAGLKVAFFQVFFNVIGVVLIWWIRWLPIMIAEFFASLAMRNRLIPIFYIIIVFYLLPAAVIWLGS